ncbi:MAG: OsmC family protein [Anaerolineae bacterium]|nr:OsmC family protein [Anaerolineae bacterium]
MSANVKVARAVWSGGFKFTAISGSGHSIVMDAAAEHGGEDAGARPMEVLLATLAGCTGMDMITVLRKQRQPVEGLEILVHGQQADQHPKKYTDITVEYVIHGNDISPDAVERAIRLSEEQYCSVAATLKGAATITSTYRIEPEYELEPALEMED